ncbi:antibiotic biosynthesis monooxygenase [Candidatus Acidianus copahuensis]|uniref:Antibiotic biosynthesis monooxygenase n=1 Tax=Candidatus Acidianus copahuensis TaxID=1160895 RepID=A0A031LT81_9CREN|nr:antibiotic biosynthesis monooxygenase [Candidatus Acidianus copahuensis]EZQ10694.1 antibiotic biosynthesis monooxygenase [Candidatus Acidianus copahuensis]
MINVGFYYKVKEGHEKEFEETFDKVVDYLRKEYPGFKNAILYKNVKEPREYLIYSEWEDLDTFKKFISSYAYKSTVDYGKTIIEGRPTHRVFQQVNT